MGRIRRDLASVEALSISKGLLQTSAQVLTAAVVISLFVPCANAIFVIIKERGLKMALALWIATFLISIAVGATLTRILESYPLPQPKHSMVNFLGRDGRRTNGCFA
jgi:Fe2+ transport system protein B